jgi:hypothetical protein
MCRDIVSQLGSILTQIITCFNCNLGRQSSGKGLVKASLISHSLVDLRGNVKQFLPNSGYHV